tara:strand:- start:562 stop:720 length:159 start_codon:yes stop_codon:yes gene_type:complete
MYNGYINEIADYILNVDYRTSRYEIKYLIKRAFKNNKEIKKAYKDILKEGSE